MPIRLMGLVDLKAINSQKSRIKEDFGDETPPPTSDHEQFDDKDTENVNAHLMRLNKMSSELYNMMSDHDDPEPWIKDKIKKAVDAINSVHGHMSYEKEKPEELSPRPDHGMDSGNPGMRNDPRDR